MSNFDLPEYALSGGVELDKNQNVVKDILCEALGSVFSDHVDDNQDNVPASDYEKSLDDDKILASQTTPAQVEEKSSPQNKNMKRVPAPAQVEGTPPAEEVGNISDSGSGIIRIPVPLVMSKGGENGQATTSRPPRRSRSRSMTSSSDTGSSSGTGNSKRSRSSSSSSMSSSASRAPASKRRRPSSSTLTTESESDDHKVDDATAKNKGGAPAGNAVNVAAAANAVEVDNVSAEKQVPEGNSTSTESEGMEDDFSALGLGNNEAGSDVYYLVIKCSAATIANSYHMMAVLEQYVDFNAQEGTDAEGIVV